MTLKYTQQIIVSALAISLGLSCYYAVLSTSVAAPETAETIESPQPLALSEFKSRLLGPKGVARWEPSGVGSDGDGLWVVSDRGGWLARYATPLREGVNRPTLAHQLKPKLPHRVKWEALSREHTKRGLS